MILHMDMDAFYASVEQLDNPELKGRCVIVGGMSGRGVVSAASYEARKFGIHSAMPVFQAKQKCPDGIFLRPRMRRYKEVSIKIMALLTDFSPLVEPISIDEAFVDITGCERIYGLPEEIAAKIKRKIKEAMNLTCSVGVAPNKFLAKVASDMAKPDGLTVITPDEAMAFIASLAIHKVPGVGHVTGKSLEAMAIKTLGDVRKYPEKTLLKHLGKFGKRLKQLSEGVDNSPVVPFTSPKSISSEETLAENTGDKHLLSKHILTQSEDVGRQLRRQRVRARTITLKIKHADFKQFTRSVTIKNPTQSSETIYKEAVKLLDAYKLSTRVRLIGVGVSGFVPVDTPVQLNLFEAENDQNHMWEKVDKTVDTISRKFGKDVIKRAKLRDP
ncbi:DNA polymerase IV [Thermodesulfobacteriota bacterium]